MGVYRTGSVQFSEALLQTIVCRTVRYEPRTVHYGPHTGPCTIVTNLIRPFTGHVGTITKP